MAVKLPRIERELLELAELAERRGSEPAEPPGKCGRERAAALGASHKTAAVALRERIALTDDGRGALPARARDEPTIHEAVVALDLQPHRALPGRRRPGRGRDRVLGRLAAAPACGPPSCVEGIYSPRNCDAARHLYRVACGPRVHGRRRGRGAGPGQARLRACARRRTTGPLTNKLFRAALETGKRVRTETGIRRGPAVIASVAVDLARTPSATSTDRHVLIIGAGETAELTARALHTQGVRTMFVANRRRERARPSWRGASAATRSRSTRCPRS